MSYQIEKGINKAAHIIATDDGKWIHARTNRLNNGQYSLNEKKNTVTDLNWPSEVGIFQWKLTLHRQTHGTGSFQNAWTYGAQI